MLSNKPPLSKKPPQPSISQDQESYIRWKILQEKTASLRQNVIAVEKDINAGVRAYQQQQQQEFAKPLDHPRSYPHDRRYNPYGNRRSGGNGNRHWRDERRHWRGSTRRGWRGARGARGGRGRDWSVNAFAQNYRTSSRSRRNTPFANDGQPEIPKPKERKPLLLQASSLSSGKEAEEDGSGKGKEEEEEVFRRSRSFSVLREIPLRSETLGHVFANLSFSDSQKDSPQDAKTKHEKEEKEEEEEGDDKMKQQEDGTEESKHEQHYQERREEQEQEQEQEPARLEDEEDVNISSSSSSSSLEPKPKPAKENFKEPKMRWSDFGDDAEENLNFTFGASKETPTEQDQEKGREKDQEKEQEKNKQIFISAQGKKKKTYRKTKQKD